MEECSRRLDRNRRSHVLQISFLFLAERKPLSQYTSASIRHWLQKLWIHSLTGTVILVLVDVDVVSAFIFSRLDYCNAVLYGLPQSSIGALQRVQNSAAHVRLRLSPRHHVRPSIENEIEAFLRFSISLALQSSISRILRSKALSAASACSRTSLAVSCRMLSLSVLICIDAMRSCSQRVMLSWLNCAHDSAVDCLHGTRRIHFQTA